MSNAKAEREELKKLEDEAYNELCQIIAEAMQFQDINLLDQRISTWKKKYAKLLDSNSSASVNFKKRIEFLLNQYYSEITQYILRQIKKNEEKRLQNQSKALVKLYKIIQETNDLSTLKKKVKDWETEYPISGFLSMYQKRIKIYTSEKYLKEHAFDQDMAFNDLYYITKLNGTYSDLKAELEKWEDKYSIHDKFELDDFIKNQSEIKRYTSDEYLISISHADNEDNELSKDIIAKNFSISSLSKQAAAYSSLLSLTAKPNNIDAVFDWVYKNNSINFNDEYKDLILRAIYLDYSPAYLNSLSVPKINLSNSLSFEEYQNIAEIKRYSVISYFNLLLPPDRRISNNYFNEYIEKIYHKSRTAKFSSQHNEPNNILEETDVLKTSDEEIEPPELENAILSEEALSVPSGIVSEKATEENVDKTSQKPKVDSSDNSKEGEKNVDSKSAAPPKQDKYVVASEEIYIIEETPKETATDSLEDVIVEKPKYINSISEKTENNPLENNDSIDKLSKPDLINYDTKALDSSHSLVINEINSENSQSNSEVVTNESKAIIPKTTAKLQPANSVVSIEDSKTSTVNVERSSNEETKNLSNNAIIALSPSFFEFMNNKVAVQKQQATIVTMIDTHVENHMSMATDKTNVISKTRIDSN